MTTIPFNPDRSVASLTMAELVTFIQETIAQTIRPESSTLIPSEIDLDSPFDRSAQPFWEIVAEEMADLPDEVWTAIPENASEQVDRYLYHL